jgi:5-methylcytosine-specific restriction enzyme A
MRLKNLKPRIAVISTSRIAVAPTHSVTERLRGRAGVERRARWLELHPLCVDCEAEDRVTAAREVDHEIPLWQGGADDESNFASRCKAHHAAKTGREAKERANG